MSFKIDFFELIFLAEACIPPAPIARAHFWDKLCDGHWEEMNEAERKHAHHFLKPKLNMNNWECKVFESRFNPDKQYELEAPNGTKHRCFKIGKEYYLTKNAKAYLRNAKSIKKLEI